jgi:ribosomal protein L11 methyltransferase
MSAERASEGAWALTFDCNRADAESLPEIGDIFPDLADPPSINVEEPDPSKPDDWRLTAYFTDKPAAALVDRITGHFASATNLVLAPLPDDDWTTLSQRGLEPVRAGRFLVHTRAHADARRTGDRALAIEAGLAFGTGQHATTWGCLMALERLARQRHFSHVADVGTGTGVLAMAVLKRWPDAAVIAGDIDPVSVDVTRRNVRDNAIRSGRRAGHAELVTAAGLSHRRFAHRAPYDLIVANILAAPLIAISRPMSHALAPGGVMVLAGLLDHQARGVAAAYRRHGLVPLRPPGRAEWPVLVLQKSPRR